MQVTELLPCVPADPDRRGLERGDVQWHPLPGRCALRDVVLHLLHRPHLVWELYPPGCCAFPADNPISSPSLGHPPPCLLLFPPLPSEGEPPHACGSAGCPEGREGAVGRCTEGCFWGWVRSLCLELARSHPGHPPLGAADTHVLNTRLVHP